MRESDLRWAQTLIKKKEDMKADLERKEEEKRCEILSKRGELKEDSIANVK